MCRENEEKEMTERLNEIKEKKSYKLGKGL